MKRHILALIGVFMLSSTVLAERYFADITSVNPEKGTIVYDITFGKKKAKDLKGNVAKNCIIREGQYRLGKPARTIEGDVLVNGLKNFVFEKASPDNRVRVSLFTADADDETTGVRKGDVVKILVHPKK